MKEALWRSGLLSGLQLFNGKQSLMAVVGTEPDTGVRADWGEWDLLGRGHPPLPGGRVAMAVAWTLLAPGVKICY